MDPSLCPVAFSAGGARREYPRSLVTDPMKRIKDALTTETAPSDSDATRQRSKAPLGRCGRHRVDPLRTARRTAVGDPRPESVASVHATGRFTCLRVDLSKPSEAEVLPSKRDDERRRHVE